MHTFVLPVKKPKRPPQPAAARREFQVKRMIVPFAMIPCMELLKQPSRSARSVAMHYTKNALNNVRGWLPLHGYDVFSPIIDQKSARQTGKEITCVWCRSSWGVTTSSKSAGAATQQHGFINLADAVPDLNAHRDTSTCKINLFSPGIRFPYHYARLPWPSSWSTLLWVQSIHQLTLSSRSRSTFVEYYVIQLIMTDF